VTDTSGLLVGVMVHPADIQDRDGAGTVIQAIPGDWTIEIVTRAAGVTGFQLLPRRWGRRANPRLTQSKPPTGKDFETSIASATAWIYIASTQLLIRRLADA
jgi:hypothetical protein